MLTPTTIGAHDCPSDKLPTGSSGRKLMRKVLVSALLITVVGLADASKGGGGEKKKDNAGLKTNFTPIRTTSGFTLKAGPTLTANYFLNTEKTSKYVSFNTLVTYQKGNSIYVMPYHYKINTSIYLDNSSGNNLRLLDLRVNLGNHK
jgi:hypothetical protein